MTQPFPLYDQLAAKAETISEVLDTTHLGTSICNLEKENAEIVFALIYHHRQIELKSTGSTLISLPYTPKVLNKGKGLYYEFSSIPQNLCKILYCFIHELSSS